MCGIIGILGKSSVAHELVDALKRLEYRGYDSAGVATIEPDGTFARRRAVGKLRNLEAVLSESPLAGAIGIGHTRWATHGGVTEKNAHPHATERVAVVHNGIIENFRELKTFLIGAGHEFKSETDTEVVAHLVTRYLDEGLPPKEAVAATLKLLTGAYALLFLFPTDGDLLIGARSGPPLAIGWGDGEMYFGSDAIALAPFTDRVTYLEDGDYAVLHRSGAAIYDAADNPVQRPMVISNAAAFTVDRGNYRHFMAKEIHEQPEVIGHTLGHYLDLTAGRTRLPEASGPRASVGVGGVDWASLDRITISACGTAYYAGLVAKYWFERIARIGVDIDVASEFRYREAPLPEKGLALFVSQSGETADTLASLRYCKQHGQTIGAVVNVPASSIGREADIVFPTLAGAEIGVASTKAFTCQLSVLAALAVAAGRARGAINEAEEQALVAELAAVPRLVTEALRLELTIERLAKRISKAKDVLYLGRGTSFPLALEGALKLKEISYIHAEGYAAGELKHGPIALIDETMPVVVIAPHDRLYEKTVSNMQEVAARGGRIILITDEAGAEAISLEATETIVLPTMSDLVAPIVYAVPVQLLAYHTAVLMGTDVDQPRNLAKSVTVE
ncbi:glutamine--fructose-6-phosphate transaminase (isomerizing) [Methyloraptor flagellatus]|jgi:glucosamine--fructose-6-phosphate aminotransferase (isomerizing)|uniref:Glutamine--fructose-6-phosphate aminotransferase [isomerizing] n=1 Tax=Methyloraptor flagellatus TaxID=3162530 RepID=A0AAU7XEF2_9HYPH